MSVVVNTSLSANGTPASGEAAARPPASTAGRSRQGLIGRDVQERVIPLVGGLDLVQAGLRHLDRRHLAVRDLVGQCRGIEADQLASLRLPPGSAAPRTGRRPLRAPPPAPAPGSGTAERRRGRVTLTSLSGLPVGLTSVTSTACTWLT